MNMHPRVAFCGESGSGKSTYAEYLAQHWKFERVSLAKPLKAGVYAAAGAFAEVGHADVDVTDKSQTVGAMIAVGEAMRGADSDIFIESAIRRHRLWQSRSDVPGIVVEDVRHENEAENLKRVGFRIIRLLARPEVTKARVIKRDGCYASALADSPAERALQFVVHDEAWENETEEDMTRNILRCDALAAPIQNTAPDA